MASKKGRIKSHDAPGDFQVPGEKGRTHISEDQSKLRYERVTVKGKPVKAYQRGKYGGRDWDQGD